MVEALEAEYVQISFMAASDPPATALGEPGGTADSSVTHPKTKSSAEGPREPGTVGSAAPTAPEAPPALVDPAVPAAVPVANAASAGGHNPASVAPVAPGSALPKSFAAAAAPRPAAPRPGRRELPLPSAADLARHRQLQREAPTARPWSPPTTITIGSQGRITRFIPLIPHLAIDLHKLPGGQLGPVAAALRHDAEELGLKGAQWLLYRVVDSRNPMHKYAVAVAGSHSPEWTRVTEAIAAKGTLLVKGVSLAILAADARVGLPAVLEAPYFTLGSDSDDKIVELFTWELTAQLNSIVPLPVLSLSLRSSQAGEPVIVDVVFDMTDREDENWPSMLGGGATFPARVPDVGGRLSAVSVAIKLLPGPRAPAPPACKSCGQSSHGGQRCQPRSCTICGRRGAQALECVTEGCHYCDNCPILPSTKGRHKTPALAKMHRESLCTKEGRRIKPTKHARSQSVGAGVEPHPEPKKPRGGRNRGNRGKELPPDDPLFSDDGPPPTPATEPGAPKVSTANDLPRSSPSPESSPAPDFSRPVRSDDISERAMQVDSDPGNLTKRSAQKVAEPTEEVDEPDPKARKLWDSTTMEQDTVFVALSPSGHDPGPVLSAPKGAGRE